MNSFCVVAIPTERAETVRKNAKDQQFGFPVYTADAGEGLPCRHCLDWIAEGKERATLFTLDPFAGIEKLLPGPVYIHADGCVRYAENAGIPMKLMTSPRTLNAYARGRRLIAQEYVDFANAEATIERLFAHPDVHYVHVRSTTAGCFTFRLERRTASNKSSHTGRVLDRDTIQPQLRGDAA